MSFTRALPHAAVCAAVLFAAQVAHGLDVGECHPIDDMTARLKAEGQQSVVFGIANAEHGTEDNPAAMSLIFATNAAGSAGYILQTDKPFRAGASAMCVRNRLANVRIHDFRRAGVPSTALLTASETQALDKCRALDQARELRAPACGFLNAILGSIERQGERVVMQAVNQRKDGGGRYASDGITVTVTASEKHTASAGRGRIQHSTPDGATVIDRVFIDTTITEGGLRLIARSPQ